MSVVPPSPRAGHGRQRPADRDDPPQIEAELAEVNKTAMYEIGGPTASSCPTSRDQSQASTSPAPVVVDAYRLARRPCPCRHGRATGPLGRAFAPSPSRSHQAASPGAATVIPRDRQVPSSPSPRDHACSDVAHDTAAELIPGGDLETASDARRWPPCCRFDHLGSEATSKTIGNSTKPIARDQLHGRNPREIAPSVHRSRIPIGGLRTSSRASYRKTMSASGRRRCAVATERSSTRTSAKSRPIGPRRRF